MARKNQNMDAEEIEIEDEDEETESGGRGRRKLGDDPVENFINAATGPTGRIQRCLDALSSLGRLSGPNYSYESEHVDTMEEAIQAQMNSAFKRLRERPPAAIAGKDGFQF